MPLESLSDNQINIHDLTLEFSKSPETKQILQRFEDLKNTVFYEKSTGLWNEGKWPSEERGAIERKHTEDQLLGVWVTALGDKAKAKNLYDDLHKTDLYDHDKQCWWHKGPPRAHWSDIDFEMNLGDQLMDIVALTKFNPELVYRQYKKYEKMASNPKNDTNTQFLNILSILPFDFDKAKSSFFDLKERRYNKETMTWYDGEKDTNYGLKITSRELLGIIVETNFSPKSAKEQYDKFHDSQYFDPEAGYWEATLTRYSDGSLRTPGAFRSQEELLDIICNHQFAKAEQEDDQIVTDLPEVRSY